MMKMLRDIGLAVCVVCIAAFASGCGGGGGGSAMTPEEPPPVMECPQGQVGTYPDCTDPGPTDEQRIAATRNTIAGIVTNARNLAQAASAAAAAVQAHEDATAEQIANALARSGDALTALTAVLAASGAGNAASTPAAAEMALADARAARDNVRTAQLAVAGIQSAVNAIAEARRQREANETALTNKSSLIKLVRDNKLLSDALLTNLASTTGGNNRIVVGAVGDGALNLDGTTAANNGVASYPANTVSDGVTNVGQRTVRVQGITSNSKTPSLTGTGRLPHGFDLNNGATATIFVDAYTDITQTVKRSGDNPRTDADEAIADPSGYELPDADYLLAGTWLSVGTNIAASTVTAFAYGNQAITAATTTAPDGGHYQINGAAANVCTNAEGTNTTNASDEVTHTRTCVGPQNFHLISRFVQDGKDITATYRGGANGIYIAGGSTSYFTADVTLTAEFQNPTSDDPGATPASDGTGSIQGGVSNIMAGGQRIEGDIELQKHTFGGDDISASFTGVAAGVIEGKIYTGGWKGQFFGMEYRRGSVYTPASTTNGVTTPQSTATTYSPEHPDSVAGTFQVIKQSAPVGDAAFIGSFAAKR